MNLDQLQFQGPNAKVTRSRKKFNYYENIPDEQYQSRYKSLQGITRDQVLNQMKKYPLLTDQFFKNTPSIQQRTIDTFMRQPTASDCPGFVYGFRDYSQYKQDPSSNQYDIKMGKTKLQVPENRIHQWQKQDNHKYVQIFTVRSEHNSKLESLVHLFFAYARKQKIIGGKRRIQWFTFKEKVLNGAITAMINFLMEEIHEINDKKMLILQGKMGTDLEENKKIKFGLNYDLKKFVDNFGVLLGATERQNNLLILIGGKRAGKSTLKMLLSHNALQGKHKQGKSQVYKHSISNSVQSSQGNQLKLVPSALQNQIKVSNQILQLKTFNFKMLKSIKSVQMALSLITEIFLEWYRIYSTIQSVVPCLLVKEKDIFEQIVENEQENGGGQNEYAQECFTKLENIVTQYLTLFSLNQNNQQEKVKDASLLNDETNPIEIISSASQSSQTDNHEKKKLLNMVITHATPQPQPQQPQLSSNNQQHLKNLAQQAFKKQLVNKKQHFSSNIVYELLQKHTDVYFFEKPVSQANYDPAYVLSEFSTMLSADAQTDFDYFAHSFEYYQEQIFQLPCFDANTPLSQRKNIISQILQDTVNFAYLEIANNFGDSFRKQLKKIQKKFESSQKQNTKRIEQQRYRRSSSADSEQQSSFSTYFKNLTQLQYNKSVLVSQILSSIKRIKHSVRQKEIFAEIFNIHRLLNTQSKETYLLSIYYVFCECMMAKVNQTSMSANMNKHNNLPQSSSPQPQTTIAKTLLQSPITYLYNTMIFDSLSDQLSQAKSQIRQVTNYFMDNELRQELTEVLTELYYGILGEVRLKQKQKMIREMGEEIIYFQERLKGISLNKSQHQGKHKKTSSQSAEQFITEVLETFSSLVLELIVDQTESAQQENSNSPTGQDQQQDQQIHRKNKLKRLSIVQLRLQRITKVIKIFGEIKTQHGVNISNVLSRVKHVVRQVMGVRASANQAKEEKHNDIQGKGSSKKGSIRKGDDSDNKIKRSTPTEQIISGLSGLKIIPSKKGADSQKDMKLKNYLAKQYEQAEHDKREQLKQKQKKQSQKKQKHKLNKNKQQRSHTQVQQIVVADAKAKKQQQGGRIDREYIDLVSQEDDSNDNDERIHNNNNNKNKFTNTKSQNTNKNIKVSTSSKLQSSNNLSSSSEQSFHQDDHHRISSNDDNDVSYPNYNYNNLNHNLNDHKKLLTQTYLNQPLGKNQFQQYTKKNKKQNIGKQYFKNNTLSKQQRFQNAKYRGAVEDDNGSYQYDRNSSNRNNEDKNVDANSSCNSNQDDDFVSIINSRYNPDRNVEQEEEHALSQPQLQRQRQRAPQTSSSQYKQKKSSSFLSYPSLPEHKPNPYPYPSPSSQPQSALQLIQTIQDGQARLQEQMQMLKIKDSTVSLSKQSDTDENESNYYSLQGQKQLQNLQLFSQQSPSLSSFSQSYASLSVSSTTNKKKKEPTQDQLRLQEFFRGIQAIQNSRIGREMMSKQQVNQNNIYNNIVNEQNPVGMKIQQNLHSQQQRLTFKQELIKMKLWKNTCFGENSFEELLQVVGRKNKDMRKGQKLQQKGVIRNNQTAPMPNPLIFNFYHNGNFYIDSEQLVIQNSLILMAKNVIVQHSSNVQVGEMRAKGYREIGTGGTVKGEKPESLNNKVVNIRFKVPYHERKPLQRLSFIMIAQKYENLQNLKMENKRRFAKGCFIQVSNKKKREYEVLMIEECAEKKGKAQANKNIQGQQVESKNKKLTEVDTINKEFKKQQEWLNTMHISQLIQLFCTKVIVK